MTAVMTSAMTAGGVASGFLGATSPTSAGASAPNTAAAGADAMTHASRALAEVSAGGSGLAMIALVTLLSVAPALLVCLTSFTRITIVLTFLRQGLGMPNVPPNQVLAALALFLTLFSMEPTLDAVWSRAVTPYLEGKLAARQAAEASAPPIREFMLRQTRPSDLMLLAQISGAKKPARPEDVRLPTVAAAFLLSELKTAFQIGLVVLLPFLLIDLLVGVVVTSLGLSGVAPATIGLPLKLALFVSIDGWNLIVGSLLRSFH